MLLHNCAPLFDTLTTAELVYGTTFHIPSQFCTPSHTSPLDDHTTSVTCLKNIMSQLKSTPTRSHKRTSYFNSSLNTCTHVFVRHDATCSALQQPWNRPYKVLKRTDKHFMLDIKGHPQVISVDRLKPAYMDSLSTTTSAATKATDTSHVTQNSNPPGTPMPGYCTQFVFLPNFNSNFFPSLSLWRGSTVA